jgi:dCMP deaminase
MKKGIAIILLTFQSMSVLSNASKYLWVKLANESLWWPSCVMNDTSDSSYLRTTFTTEDNNLLVVRFLGTEDNFGQSALAALSLLDRGLSWEYIDSVNHSQQTVSASLKSRYSTALSILSENVCTDISNSFRNNNYENDNIVDQQFSIETNTLSTTSPQKAIETEKDNSFYGARDLISPVAKERYDLEGVGVQDSNSNNQDNNHLFTEKIDNDFLQRLDECCTVSKAKSAIRVLKRANVVPWDDYFMAVAFLSAMRSKDPSTQVGACIVNPDKRIVGIGYNGFPRGCSDDELPWAREAVDELDTKYPYVCHAEVNAILNKNNAEIKGCSIYVALFPCNDCAKMIIQSGISEVVYLSDKYKDTNSMRASKRMMNMAGVSYYINSAWIFNTENFVCASLFLLM